MSVTQIKNWPALNSLLGLEQADIVTKSSEFLVRLGLEFRPTLNSTLIVFQVQSIDPALNLSSAISADSIS